MCVQVPPPKWDGPELVERGPNSGAAASFIMLHGFTGSGLNCRDSLTSLEMSGLRLVFPSAPTVLNANSAHSSGNGCGRSCSLAIPELEPSCSLAVAKL